jgi:dihydrofolate reductase
LRKLVVVTVAAGACALILLGRATRLRNTIKGEGPRTESTVTDKICCDLSISADGYSAGPGQTAEKPFGEGPVDRLHAWMFETPNENKAEIDQVVSAGAFVMGRHMFGPGRGEWDLSWTGWWGGGPALPRSCVRAHPPPARAADHAGRHDVHVRDRGIESALDLARKAAGDRDVAIVGGASTVNQYLAAGLIDELRTHVAPVTLGAGERLFDGVPPLPLEVIAVRGASQACGPGDGRGIMVPGLSSIEARVNGGSAGTRGTGPGYTRSGNGALDPYVPPRTQTRGQ